MFWINLNLISFLSSYSHLFLSIYAIFGFNNYNSDARQL